MAETMVDYTFFFRELCNFRTSPDEIFEEQLSLDDLGKDETKVCKCLLLLLDSLEKIPESCAASSVTESAFSMSDMNSQLLDGSSRINLANGSIDEMGGRQYRQQSEDAAFDIPSAEDIIDRWRTWTELYKSRLLDESLGVTSQTTVPLAITPEDLNRQIRMRKINPKYIPRTWILQELCDMCVKEPDLQPKKNSETSESKKTHAEFLASNVKKPQVQFELRNESETLQRAEKKIVEGGIIEIERFLRVAVQDIWGEIADSEAGWKNDMDRKMSEKWSGLPPDWGRNFPTGCSS
ncbi:hypothetical protein HK096_002148 [Nowakowskiella sp. JEL0078]|nr:hypothetical protein HK096_002148 [Nowakowskiella sp. JEL0078]